MSALSGVWNLAGDIDPEHGCRAMLEAQGPYGPDATDMLYCGDVALGRSLYRTLPEDEYDAQPLTGGSGRFRLVADLRIDNRAELARKLGLDAGDCADLADSSLLMKAIERWHVSAVDHVSGDFAFALWDAVEHRLTLARDPLGERPLHYHAGKGFFAFASMPRALFALKEIPPDLDARRLAELVAELRPPPDGTYYRNVQRVPTGHVLTVRREGVSARRYWDPPLRTLRLPSDDDYVEAYRERVDHAVRARLRGTDGLVASHLSAGYDSGTVTATAARLLSGSGQVLAFTSAPRPGFDGQVPRGRVADETPYAAMTAALYPNIEHIILRSDGTSQLSLLDPSHALGQYPIGQLSNNIWWSRINYEASRRGARVLLNGGVGNHGLSAGGLGLLADLLRQGRWLRWLREARLLVDRGPARWRGVFANSFGPWLPKRVWVRVNAAFAGASPRANTPYLLTSQWAREIDNSVNPGRDTLPPKDSYELRRRLLQSGDQGTSRKWSLAGSGIDERDPTSDRQLLEFCLSLPPEQLLKDGKARPLAKRALADRLPPLILEGGPRGYQMADWYEALDRAEIGRHIDLIAASPLASSIIDVDRLRAMVEDWPQGDWNGNRVVQEYRFAFLIALSVGHFIRTFPGKAA